MITCKFSNCLLNIGTECHDRRPPTLVERCENSGKVGPNFVNSFDPNTFPAQEAVFCFDIYCKWHVQIKNGGEPIYMPEGAKKGNKQALSPRYKGFCDKDNIVINNGKCQSKRVK